MAAPAGAGPPLAHRPAPAQAAGPSGAAPAPPTNWAQLPSFRPAKFVNKRVDLPAEAYVDLSPYASGATEQAARVALTTKFARRPKFNTTGGNITVGVNQFRVKQMPTKDVHQFDVSATPVGTRKHKPNEPIKDIVFKKCWQSKVFQAELEKLGYLMIYDGAKLAWATGNTEIRVNIDLDVEKGNAPREDKTNEFRFVVRPTKVVRLACLTAYLGGKMTWDTSVTEAMNFLDHLIRQGPSEKFKLIKRSFFNLHSEKKDIGKCVEAVKGIYSAIRMNESISIQGLTGLGINVDVSNQAFWVGQSLIKLVVNYLASVAKKPVTERDLITLLKPTNGGRGPPPAWNDMKKLHRLRFVTTHRTKGKNEEYTIKNFTGGQGYGGDGATARTVKFDRRDPKDPTKTTRISIYDYYLSEFKLRLQYPDIPLVETGKGSMFPMEVCLINRLNPYPYKLDGQQTTDMLGFAVQRPGPRKDQIQKCVDNLGWDKDRHLKSFGLVIDPAMPMVPSKLLNPPKLQFGKNRFIEPRFTGRWDLRGGVNFIEPNKTPLKSWGLAIFDHSIPIKDAEGWAKKFVLAYRAHGGTVAGEPIIEEVNVTNAPKNVVLTQVKAFAERVYNKSKQPPQLLFFAVKAKVAHPYELLKNIADTQMGVPSQVVLGNNIRKGNEQYTSNVCLKVNAKLGGTTCRPVPTGTINPKSAPLVPPRTAMIGVDVSHGSPGSNNASLASLCLSMDKDCAFYTGAVQTNGYRVEILTPENVHGMLSPLVKQWIQRNSASTMDNVFYFRDGVSEGQFAHVIDYELAEMRKVFKTITGKVPKITVIVATKRHHIRFFPPTTGADRNGNAKPGTLVEKEITHPFHYDFYLCSHVAIQGTARPVHYNIIHDEVKMSVDDLQRMIYFQCYQYVRSTTPVSLHPAVYYAHLAGNRGRCHEAVGGAPVPLQKATSEATTVMPPAPKLNRLGSPAVAGTMWYI
ncbi:hypothetical protein QBC39DRAFT_96706 [Podospora conica]|nr:hypothetical protein QBC39DRAFT_96706 [Schizothecium conicum]